MAAACSVRAGCHSEVRRRGVLPQAMIRMFGACTDRTIAKFEAAISSNGGEVRSRHCCSAAACRRPMGGAV